MLVLALTAGMVFLNRSGIAFLFPAIKPALGLSNEQLGQTMAATSIAWAISSVGASLVSDAFAIRPRVMLAVCVIGFCVVGALSGMVTNFPTLLLLRGAMGLFEGPVIPIVQATVVGLSTPTRRAGNLGIIMAVSAFAGSVLAPPMMTGLAAAFGWRSCFLFIALPGAPIVAALWYLLRPNGPGQAAASERVNLRDVARLATRRNVILSAVGTIAHIGSNVVIGGFLPLYLSSLGSFSSGERVAVFIAAGFAACLGGLFVPALSDVLGRRPVTIVACLGTIAAPVAIMLMSVSTLWVVPAVLLVMASSGALVLMLYVLPGESVPPAMAASTLGILAAIGEIVGGSVAPTMAGILADRHGVIFAFAVPCVLGGVAFLAALAVRYTDLHSNSATGGDAALRVLPAAA